MIESDLPRQEENEMSLRQRGIFKTLVQEYTGSATPVGSGTIRRIGTMGVSSATIRNELARLEELGFIYQPHTSAGRVPTVKGYRYFIEQLMEQAELPMAEKRMIQHQFHQIRLNLDQWLRLTATVLAQTMQSGSLVTPPHASSSRFKHLELISINDTLCLMILVLKDSSIHQEMLLLSNPVDQLTLSETSNRLNALLSSHSAREIEESTNPELTMLQGLGALVVQRVLQVMTQADDRSVSEIYRDGLAHVLRQPEFEDAEKLRQILEILEHSTLLETILGRTLKANGVQIIIGGEGSYEEIDDVSLVLSPYGIRSEASGVIGIIGPTRMAYARAISTVRYVAHLMSLLVAEVYSS